MRTLIIAASVLATLGLAGCASASENTPGSPAGTAAAVEGNAIPTVEGAAPPTVSPNNSGPEAAPSAGTPSQNNASPSDTAASTQVVTYTSTDVAGHNTAEDCWTSIDGSVYDLTQWIQAHPGGSAVIISLCGTDGTEGFLGQHEGEGQPTSILDSYRIGQLVE